MTKKKKKQGHYCRICDERKSNESFSGSGHIKHICKVCDALPLERKNELQIINRIGRTGEKYPKSRQDWDLLEKYAKSNKYPEAKEFALFFLSMSGRQISKTTNKIERITSESTIVFSELDEDTQDDISDELYEEIFDFIIRKERKPEEKDKLNILKKLCKAVSKGYGETLILDEQLKNIFDQALVAVVKDLDDGDE